MRGTVKQNMVIGALLLGLCTGPAAAGGQEAPAFTEITPEQISAAEKGLAFLARTQNRDGSWDSGNYRMHAGITALAGLAFMAGGSLPGDGGYGEHVKRGLGFVLKSMDKDGLIESIPSSNPMYGHGYATLFLAEIYGMTGDRDVRPHLRRAVDLIISSQHADGGWRYKPDPNGESDISVTVVELMALRAARNAGIAVDAGVIDRALDYVVSSQCDDGGFSYTLTHKRSGFARTAAGLTSLYVGGRYEGDVIERGLKYLAAVRTSQDQRMQFYYYGNYYAAKAMFQAGGQYWEDWFPWIRSELLASQMTDGSWVQNSSAGPVFATAMSVMILEIPFRYLPIFQR